MSIDWQAELARAFRNASDLLAYLGMGREDLPELGASDLGFPLLVTNSYAERIVRGDPADPLLRQVVPLAAELEHRAGFGADPVGDLGAVATPGLLRKYPGRALLITTGACAIHCRYCFRREFPYDSNMLRGQEEISALNAIRSDPSLKEVILSGGDPLLLSDNRLHRLLKELGSISHLTRQRIHTRVPIVLPSRITPDLINILTGTRLRAVVVLHANHPNELDAAVGQALDRLHAAGVVLLNQSVLLKGVNDDVETLLRLSEQLMEFRVTPYYLHQLDRARGTAHFEVPEDCAGELMESLRQRLPGYLVPRFVREVPGSPYKMPLR